MTPGTNNPVESRLLLRNLFSGIVGADHGDFWRRVEERTVRAIRARARQERRRKNLAEQQQLRKDAVKRREQKQMLAAEYARDRRASGATRTLSKRDERRQRTAERIARKREEVHT